MKKRDREPSNITVGAVAASSESSRKKVEMVVGLLAVLVILGVGGWAFWHGHVKKPVKTVPIKLQFPEPKPPIQFRYVPPTNGNTSAQ